MCVGCGGQDVVSDVVFRWCVKILFLGGFDGCIVFVVVGQGGSGEQLRYAVSGGCRVSLKMNS